METQNWSAFHRGTELRSLRFATVSLSRDSKNFPGPSLTPALGPFFRQSASGRSNRRCAMKKILIAAAAGWIAFYVVDQALFDGRLTSTLPRLARAIAAGFGFYF